MHRRKLVRRGYNQAQELAALLGRELGWPCAGVLKRLPDRLPQASLARKQRLRHARRIYAADEKESNVIPSREGTCCWWMTFLRPGPRRTPARICCSGPGGFRCVLTLARTHHAWHG